MRIETGTLLCAVFALVPFGGCTVGYKPLTVADKPAASSPAPPAAPAAPPASTGQAPTPRTSAAIEVGVHTLRLEYALPERTAVPDLISFEQIHIVDEIGKPCPVVSTHFGKSTECWASISFSSPPESRKITARFVLSLDNVDYPLAAILTRIDASHWRVDYGVLPGEGG